MLTPFVQRWRAGRDFYRVAGEPIVTREYEVALIPDDTTAMAFVLEHHYDDNVPPIVRRAGLFRRGQLVGVAIFSVPINPHALDCLPCPRSEGAELGRFVLLDEVPANGETWFLARAFELARREGIAGIISFSDPLKRTTIGGAVVHRGHVGVIYQAHNAVYLGPTRPGTLPLLPDGHVFHRRAITKIAGRERGCRYAAARLERFGARPLTADEDSRAWLAEWLPKLTRAVPHPGNHKYAWGLTPRIHRRLPKSKKYPKMFLEPLAWARPSRGGARRPRDA